MFPLDYWWRKKHEIPFNSLEHRKVLIEDITFEYEEEQLYKNLYDEETYILNSGQWLKTSNKQSQPINEEEAFRESLEEFKNIDLSQYDE
jgi:hypothetical protein